jgi:hypothetical protein
VESIRLGKAEMLGEKPVPVPLLPSEISHELVLVFAVIVAKKTPCVSFIALPSAVALGMSRWMQALWAIKLPRLCGDKRFISCHTRNTLLARYNAVCGTVAVYCENKTKHVSTVREQNADSLTVQGGCTTYVLLPLWFKGLTRHKFSKTVISSTKLWSNSDMN